MSRHLDRFRDLDAAADEMLGATPNAGTVEADDDATEVHRQVIELLNELLGLLNDAPSGPLLTLVRLLKRCEPMLLKDFSKVPPEQITMFLHELGRRMLRVGAIEPAEVAPDAEELVG